MTRLRVALLANPAAARGSSHDVGRHVYDVLRAAGVHVVDVSGPDAPVARARALDVMDSVQALIVVGGDGTVRIGADVAARTGTALGIVAAGSGNDFARTIGLPVNDPAASVAVILDALGADETWIDAIEVSRRNPDGSTSSHVCVGNLSLGFDAIVARRANRSRYGYTPAVVREIARFRPLDYWLEIDGGAREHVSASVLTLCNLGVFGAGMHISPSSRLDDGHLELAMISGLSRVRMLALFPKVLNGSHVDVPGFTVRSVRSLTVGLENQIGFMSVADGDDSFAMPLHATVRPRAVRVLTGSRAVGHA